MTGVYPVVVVPFYGSPDLLQRCLGSLSDQDDDLPFDVVIADDGSPTTDGVDLAHRWAMHRPLSRGAVQIRRSEVNEGALSNIIKAIRATPMDPDSPVIVLDGDDRLKPHCVRTIRQILGATSNLLTYGSYEADPPDDSCPPALPIPDWVLRAGCVRELARYSVIPTNHPLSFRRCLFDALEEADFCMPDGSRQKHGYDLCLSMPMVELAGTRVEFCPDSLYVYTSDRADSAARAHRAEIIAENAHVIAAPRKYTAMEWEPAL